MIAKTIARSEFDRLKNDVDDISKLLEGNSHEAGIKTTVAILRDNYKTLSDDVKTVKAWEMGIFAVIIADILLRVFKVGI